ncbi:MAG: SDR family oxidoreductase [Flammeovirgaceae bacterium]|nr:SDR family oxidoreductase [Flammeovirgaceae bacterium]
MKILFIGGTGNISASCTRLAIEKGHEVYLLIRGSGNREVPKGAKVIKGDIKDIPGTKAAIKDHYFDAVANFIAFTPEDIENDIEIFKGKADQYIFISSASCYQKPLSHPIVTESTPLKNPFWKYSRDKIACEDLLNKVYREDDFPITIVRPSLTYGTVIPVAIGSWEDYTIIDRMKKGKKVIVHGDGTSLWTITHADDFAIGFTGLLGHQQAIGHAFHITSDEILTWNQIYEAVAAAAGVKPNFVHIPSTFIAKFDEFQVGNLIGDKSVSVVFDNTKIKTFVPEFNAPITFKKGIKRTVEWFEAKTERMKIVEENNILMDKIIAAYESL